MSAPTISTSSSGDGASAAFVPESPDTLANRPAAAPANTDQLYLATDVDGGTLYQSNGSSWVQVAAGVSALPPYPAVPTVSGTTDTLTDADGQATIRYTNASQVTVTIPTDATEDLDDGWWCILRAEGAGGLTLSTTGITLPGAPNTTIAQGEGLFVQKTASADTWIVLGGTS